jgi:hypothetical protein
VAAGTPAASISFLNSRVSGTMWQLLCFLRVQQHTHICGNVVYAFRSCYRWFANRSSRCWEKGHRCWFASGTYRGVVGRDVDGLRQACSSGQKVFFRGHAIGDGGAILLDDLQHCAARAQFFADHRQTGWPMLNQGFAFERADDVAGLIQRDRLADVRGIVSNGHAALDAAKQFAPDVGIGRSVNLAEDLNRSAAQDGAVLGAPEEAGHLENVGNHALAGRQSAISRSTLYFVYYDDLQQQGGAITFNATTTKEVALQTIGRYFVGSILTPKAGSDATIGNSDGGAGAQSGNLFKLLATLAKDSVNGDAAFVPIRNTFGSGSDSDGDLTTAVLYSGTPGTRFVAGFPTVIGLNWSSLKLKIKTQVLSAGTQPLQLDYSLDNGATWNNVYTIAAFGGRATTIDVFNLAITQNPALVQVRYTMNGNGNWNLFEAWIEGQT